MATENSLSTSSVDQEVALSLAEGVYESKLKRVCWRIVRLRFEGLSKQEIARRFKWDLATYEAFMMKYGDVLGECASKLSAFLEVQETETELACRAATQRRRLKAARAQDRAMEIVLGCLEEEDPKVRLTAAKMVRDDVTPSRQRVIVEQADPTPHLSEKTIGILKGSGRL